MSRFLKAATAAALGLWLLGGCPGPAGVETESPDATTPDATTPAGATTGTEAPGTITTESFRQAVPGIPQLPGRSTFNPPQVFPVTRAPSDPPPARAGSGSDQFGDGSAGGSGGTSGGQSGGGDNGSGGQQSPPEGSPPASLDSIDDAVRFIVLQFESVTITFGLFSQLGDENLTLIPNTLRQYGTCPDVSIANGTEVSLIDLTFHNCKSEYTAQRVVSGSNGDILFHDQRPTAVYVTTPFAYDGRQITPLLDHPEFPPSLLVLMSCAASLRSDGLHLDGTCDFRMQDVGRANGMLVVDLLRGNEVAIPSATLSFSTDEVELPAVFAMVRLNPVSRTSFIPYAGTARFAVTIDGSAHNVEVTFTERSPSENIVLISVDGGEKRVFRFR